MARPVTLFTGQWADLPLTELAKKAGRWGYNGLELACWGDYFDPVKFIRTFPDRIYHVHMKDAKVTLDGTSGILSSYLDFGQPGRGWDFRSLGRGEVDFEEIIRALNEIGYDGPLSVEWEDAAMDREAGAQEAVNFVKEIDFPPSSRTFDETFATE